jgi:subtilisin-like proprotein convertase family protein
VQLELDTQFDEGDGTTGFPLEIGQTRVLAAATGLPVSIPKKTHNPLTTTAEVTDSFLISDIQATISILHEDVGQLLVDLTSPQGTTVRLHNGTLSGTADLSVTYDTSRQPDGPGSMNDFDFEPAIGNWTLTVQDIQSGPVAPGQIVSWSLELTSSSPINCSPLSCTEPVPDAVGPSLIVAAENGTDLRFTWSALAGAASYRVWSSTAPDLASERLVDASVATTLSEPGALGEPSTLYYVVRAVNACEWEGP